jgi:hypothetical protein
LGKQCLKRLQERDRDRTFISELRHEVSLSRDDLSATTDTAFSFDGFQVVHAGPDQTVSCYPALHDRHQRALLDQFVKCPSAVWINVGRVGLLSGPIGRPRPVLKTTGAADDPQPVKGAASPNQGSRLTLTKNSKGVLVIARQHFGLLGHAMQNMSMLRLDHDEEW